MAKINANALSSAVFNYNTVFCLRAIVFYSLYSVARPSWHLAIAGFVLIYYSTPKPPLSPSYVSHANKPLSRCDLYLLTYLSGLPIEFGLKIVDLSFEVRDFIGLLV